MSFTNNESIGKVETTEIPAKSERDSTIPFWKLGRVIIYPHIEFSSLWTYDQILAAVKDLQLNCVALGIKIYEKNSYCSEVNGRWNVVFSVRDFKGDYTYMIRRDHTLKKTFACPFYNEQYGYIGDTCLNKTRFPVGLDILERYLLGKHGGKLIDRFQTEL
tara:strand:- start:72 stop:554 length:483 start_codon:yes stop_codon:yes gene_type:complete